MVATAVILMAALGGSVLSSGAVANFPGGYFDSQERESFQREVMASWPGPTELMRLWKEGELSQEQRVAVLLGGAVYHDPMMIPAYREAFESETRRLRQAAIYGFRDLIGDRPPNVTRPIDEQALTAFAGEMRWVQHTLRRHSLLEMWLQSALAEEGTSLPGYMGVTFTRPSNACFRAVERLVDVGDLDLLVTAYELSQDMGNRIALLKLIEAMTLSRFIVMPSGQNAGWGMEVFESALRTLDGRVRQWRGPNCELDGEAILRRNLRALGARNRDPLGSSAVHLWLALLEGGNSKWWMLAARRLYACGGPWYELSVLSSDDQRNRRLQQELATWFRPKQRAKERTPRLRRWTDR